MKTEETHQGNQLAHLHIKMRPLLDFRCITSVVGGKVAEGPLLAPHLLTLKSQRTYSFYSERNLLELDYYHVLITQLLDFLGPDGRV